MPVNNNLGWNSQQLLQDVLPDPNLVFCAPLNEASGNFYDRCLATQAVGVPLPGQNLSSRWLQNAASQYFSNSSTATQMGDINFTIAVWVQVQGTGLGNEGIVGRWTTGGNQRQYALLYNDATGQFNFSVSNNGTAVVTVANTTPVNTYNWQLLVAWHDPVANTINLQVDNGAVASAAHSTGVYVGTGNFTVGPPDIGYFDGLIGPVGVWKRQLTSTERSILYRSATPTAWDYAGLIAAYPAFATSITGYWDMTDAQGAGASDNSRSGLNLTANGGSILVQDGIIPDVFSGYSQPVKTFSTARLMASASSQSFNIASNATLVMGAGVSFTLAAWVKLTTLPAASDTAGIAGKWSSAVSREYLLAVATDAGGATTFQFITRNTANTTTTTLSATNFGPPVVGVWYLVVATFDSSTNTMSISVNNGVPNTTTVSTGVFSGTTAFYVGWQNEFGVVRYLNGSVGATALWKRALTTSEIGSLYRGPAWGWNYSQFAYAYPAATYALVSWWDMTEASGNATDSFGTNTLTATNTPTTSAGTIISDTWDYYGLNCDSGYNNLNNTPYTGNYVDFGNLSNLNFGYRSPQSILMVIQPYNLFASGKLFTKRTISKGWEVFMDNSRLLWWKLVAADTTNECSVSTAAAAAATGTAVMVLLTYTGSGLNTGMTIYVNGASVALTARVNNLVSDITTSATVQIGAANSSLLYFNGNIAMVAAFNSTKTAADARRWATLGGFR